MYIIKRYNNRKCYDLQQHCYVSLSEIEELIRTNDDVNIVDNNTGDDITGQIMLSVIANKKENSEDIFILEKIIRKASGILSNIMIDA